MGNLTTKNSKMMEESGHQSSSGRSFLIGPEGDAHINGNPDYVRFVFISDTHSMHGNLKLPKGDVLIHTGDFTFQGMLHEVKSFSDWLGTLDFKHKLVIAGNHEVTFDKEKEQLIRSTFQLG